MPRENPRGCLDLESRTIGESRSQSNPFLLSARCSSLVPNIVNSSKAEIVRILFAEHLLIAIALDRLQLLGCRFAHSARLFDVVAFRSVVLVFRTLGHDVPFSRLCPALEAITCKLRRAQGKDACSVRSRMRAPHIAGCRKCPVRQFQNCGHLAISNRTSTQR